MFTRQVTEDLAIALVQPSFAKNYYEIVCREREYLSHWLAWPPHANGEAFFETFVKSALHDYAEGKSLTCAMVYQDEIVGNISFNSINHELKKVEIGYWLSESFQGKGIASRCVQALIDIAFQELEMEKIQIAAATENLPSRKLAERLGFVLEGIITRNENLNGRVVDHAIYGLSVSRL
ncbi:MULTISPECIES: GNAT family N-acetyltransferase [Grimontia]|uniref:Putative ribosomal N-acetyltransferase YdaF n=1 Tax=Grimontia marina TaxID=646534 RepID=A0A128FCD3_9GAMM|nr:MULTISPECIES: GNAT family protein [Grimontia]WRW01051.1 GNAT family protein [Grimontia sp. NTOU-MAR1]CZF84459.1 Putative ribosomal N-acetyltransferase YdaF [Grimontia marina]